MTTGQKITAVSSLPNNHVKENIYVGFMYTDQNWQDWAQTLEASAWQQGGRRAVGNLVVLA